MKPLYSTALLCLFSCNLLAQGSLVPSGPPAPSMKTLGQIEPRVAIGTLPFSITNEGAFYLTTNLLVATGTNGIIIDANNVTLDLGGFTLRGANESLNGIFINPGRANVSIKNGVIAGTANGLLAFAATRVQVDNLRVLDCRGMGISVGPEAVIVNCQANGNGASGISAGAASSIANSQANFNLNHGMQLQNNATVHDCSVYKNIQSGLVAGDSAKLSVVSATENGNSGIQVNNGANISSCVANQNTLHGIQAGHTCRISGTSAAYNALNGIVGLDNTHVADCHASQNLGTGISTGISADVADCKAELNQGRGIAVGRGSSVRDCSAQRNRNDGILITEQCTAVRNHCHGNSAIPISFAVGLNAAGSDNVIQDNYVTSNDRGISVNAGGNFISKNRAANNTLAYSLGTLTDQIAGPIVTTMDQPEATHPHANFAF